jgi:anti-anti-sigma regulatory factor
VRVAPAASSEKIRSAKAKSSGPDGRGERTRDVIFASAPARRCQPVERRFAMSIYTFDREVEGERATIRLSGSFDRSHALELREWLGHEDADQVVLDFSLVRDFTDLGVATLANGLTRMERLPLLRGLRQHQLRIFRYCGVDVEPPRQASPRDDALPEETVARSGR